MNMLAACFNDIIWDVSHDGIGALKCCDCTPSETVQSVEQNIDLREDGF